MERKLLAACPHPNLKLRNNKKKPHSRRLRKRKRRRRNCLKISTPMWTPIQKDGYQDVKELLSVKHETSGKRVKSSLERKVPQLRKLQPMIFPRRLLPNKGPLLKALLFN